MALSLAAAVGFASLIVGWVRRDPASSPASRTAAAPAILGGQGHAPERRPALLTARWISRRRRRGVPIERRRQGRARRAGVVHPARRIPKARTSQSRGRASRDRRRARAQPLRSTLMARAGGVDSGGSRRGSCRWWRRWPGAAARLRAGGRRLPARAGWGCGARALPREGWGRREALQTLDAEGRRRVSRGDSAGAAQSFGCLVADDPTPEAAGNLAVVLREQGNLGDALLAARCAEDLAPPGPARDRARTRREEIEHRLGMPSSAPASAAGRAPIRARWCWRRSRRRPPPPSICARRCRLHRRRSGRSAAAATRRWPWPPRR